MGLKNTKTFPARELDINLENDRRIVREFEKELEPFAGKSIVVMTGTPYRRELRGFELYLHENGIFRYSERYPLGAVVDAEAMHTALSRYEALRRLVDRREWANKQVPSV